MSFAISFALVSVGALLFWLGRYLTRRGDEYNRRADDLQRHLDAFIANAQASPFCCKSIAYRLCSPTRCECFVCRNDRGESVTEATQTLAEQVQLAALQADLAQQKGA